MNDCHSAELFRAREGGYFSYRIPAVAAVGERSLLAVCEGRVNDPWDSGHIDILLRRSDDAGETWGPPSVLVSGEGRTAHSPVMIASPGENSVHLLYCRDYRRCYHTISRDGGATFGPPRDITPVFEEYRREYGWELISTTPGHAIRLRTGRLLVPVWLSTSKAQKPTAASVIYSDDGGERWHRGPIIVRDGDGGAVANPMEPIVVELGDGRVLLNVRNASPPRRRATAISADGVNGWSPLSFDAQLNEPFCHASILLLPATVNDPRDTLVWANPDELTNSGQMGTEEVGGCDRKRLTVKLSRDGGVTWAASRVLEPGWAGYCDLAVTRDGTIVCLYESGCVEEMMWDVASIRAARFTAAWVT